MAVATIQPEFAILECIKNKANCWDIYTSETSGIVSTQQNTDLSIDDSMNELRNSFSSINADRVKLKASGFSREQKGTNPKLKNILDVWIQLDNQKKNVQPGVNMESPSILVLMQQVYELRLQIEVDKIKRDVEDSKGSALDGISAAILGDPHLKMGLLGIMNKIAGIQAPLAAVEQVVPVAKIGTTETIHSDEYLTQQGFNVNNLITLISKYEQSSPGSIRNFVDGLNKIGITA